MFYSDISPNFALDVDKDVSASYDIRSVKNALFALISTNKGDRPFMPEFGCNLSNELFENFNPFVAASMENSIVSAIRNFEPRIDRLAVSVYAEPDSNSVIIRVMFSVITDPETINELKIKRTA